MIPLTPKKAIRASLILTGDFGNLLPKNFAIPAYFTQKGTE